MRPIKTLVDHNSEAYQSNFAANLASVERLKEELAKSTRGGGEHYVQRHLKRGKLLPRERVEMLLDEGSYFLEIAPLAGHDMEAEFIGAGVVGGIGLVSGKQCFLIANEATVKGGAVSEIGSRKNARLAEIVALNHLPSISLVESAGADLPVQHKIFVPGGAGFKEITRRSKARIPSVSVVFGNSTAGGAYLPGMSDYVVMVKNQAHVFLGGPPLVKMATGEIVDEESLGGAEMHSKISGLSDYLAENELDALRIAREIVAHLEAKPPPPRIAVEAPIYSADELLGVVSADVRVPFEAREVIARLVDGSRFVSCSRSSGSTFSIGATTVNCSASDNHGNSTNASFRVTVQDTTRPRLFLRMNSIFSTPMPCSPVTLPPQARQASRISPLAFSTRITCAASRSSNKMIGWMLPSPA